MVDEVVLTLSAGKGGDGLVSFRREKFVPKGGPDGGDGGRGADIVIRADREVTTLADFQKTRSFKAPDGKPGQNKKKTGKSAQVLILTVAPGTLVYDQTSSGHFKQLADLDHGQSIIALKGGRGGLGNCKFVSPTNRAPRKASPGQLGETKRIKLVLKLIAQVGLVGLANVGKSSLLARLTKARPKISSYPFTTLEPNLGVIEPKNFSITAKPFVVADMPGLIKGSSLGKGLGLQFLRHIDRTKVLVFIIDASSPNPKNDFETIQKEISAYNPKLNDRPRLVAISKIDLMNEKKQRALWSSLRYLNPIFISSLTGRGLSDLVKAILEKFSSKTV